MLWRCIINIPICGGFCAETENPERSCLKHFSNEMTVPQPCVVTHGCRLFWEHSRCCISLGGIGTRLSPDFGRIRFIR